MNCWCPPTRRPADIHYFNNKIFLQKTWLKRIYECRLLRSWFALKGFRVSTFSNLTVIFHGTIIFHKAFHEALIYSVHLAQSALYRAGCSWLTLFLKTSLSRFWISFSISNGIFVSPLQSNCPKSNLLFKWIKVPKSDVPKQQFQYKLTCIKQAPA